MSAAGRFPAVRALVPVAALLLVQPGRAAEPTSLPPPPAAPAQDPPPGARPPFDPLAPAEQQFKNIKVLKSIPAGQMRDAMEFIEGALGVGCGYCHVRGGMEKDDKPAKEVARKMILMTEGINRDFFEGKPVVTCFTCHQGREKAVSIPALAAPAPAVDAFVADAPRVPAAAPQGSAAVAPSPPPAEQRPPLPTAEAVLARFVDAVGGRGALDALGALRLRGSQADGEHPASVEIIWQAPASAVTALRSGDGERSFTFSHGTDGTTAWARRGEEPATDLSGSRRTQALAGAELLPAVAFPGVEAKTEVLGSGTIRGQAVVVLGVFRSDGTSSRLYFDGESGLLVRRAYEIPTPLGPMPHQVDYADWSPVRGVKLPHSVVARQPGESATVTFDVIEPAGVVDASTFAKPAG